MFSPDTLLGGRYRLTDPIAAGGMGEIWKAQDTVLERVVAVKVLLPELVTDTEFIQRFQAEAKIVAALDHPNIVSVYDYGEAATEDGSRTAYLVMQFVDGESLADRLERGTMEPAEVLPLTAAIARALQHAHEHGIVHRDIKPGNILLRRDGRAILTDFGIARSHGSADLTQTGAVMGTASYIAPEQAEGLGATALSDQYSLGVVAYHALSGAKPFNSENPIEVALHHIRTQPQPLPQHLPPAVVRCVATSMAKDPAQRYANSAEFASAAEAALQGQAVTPSGGTNRTSVMTGVPAGAPAPQTGAYGAPPVGEGSGSGTPGGGKSRLTLVAVLATVLTIVLAGGAAWYFTRGGEEDPDNGGTVENTSEPSDSASESDDDADEPDDDNDDDDTDSPGGQLGECLDPDGC
ncbi:protein kinase domain-containing protein [Salininema proteolyticum]|uniref:non-specific serine/threonine protein kinase n=1 Tax=Salininema proteolyticum TaxID=1607685 RepID=A0ABV8TW08_9ACTN